MAPGAKVRNTLGPFRNSAGGAARSLPQCNGELAQLASALSRSTSPAPKAVASASAMLPQTEVEL